MNSTHNFNIILGPNYPRADSHKITTSRDRFMGTVVHGALIFIKNYKTESGCRLDVNCLHGNVLNNYYPAKL